MPIRCSTHPRREAQATHHSRDVSDGHSCSIAPACGSVVRLAVGLRNVAGCPAPVLLAFAASRATCGPLGCQEAPLPLRWTVRATVHALAGERERACRIRSPHLSAPVATRPVRVSHSQRVQDFDGCGSSVACCWDLRFLGLLATCFCLLVVCSVMCDHTYHTDHTSQVLSMQSRGQSWSLWPVVWSPQVRRQ